MFESDGATATAPIDTVASWSNWCSNVVPLLIVLSSPPEAVAIHHIDESFPATAMSVIRPPILAGPIDRQLRLLSHWESSSKDGGAAALTCVVAVDGALGVWVERGSPAGAFSSCTSLSSVCRVF